MVTKEKISELVSGSYRIAVSHGFHDDYHSVAHYLMLVLSEIGEMVEADRKGNWFKDEYTRAKAQYGKSQETTHLSKYLFEKYAKDTVEDEMADVVIRLCDLCGSLGVLPMMNAVMADLSEEFKRIWGDASVCEQCFGLSCLVVDIEKVSDDADDTEMRRRIGSAICFVFEMARFHGIDLLWHIDRKMEYNELRPCRHGKSY